MDIQEQSDLYYSDELRKKLDKSFNNMLKGTNSNFNSFYDKKSETLFLNFNIYKTPIINKIEINFILE